MSKKTVFATKHPSLSVFDLSHEHKLTCNIGKLVPVMVQEVIPGDTFKVTSDMFLRLMPLAAPMMHRVEAYLHFFFVPTRLVWSEFDKFLTGGPDGTDEPVYPFLRASRINTAIGELSDYFGIPRQLDSALHINALPFRAYNLIYNEWYRDETLISPKVVNTTSGEDTGASYDVYRRAWKKGYFESALPWTQRGIAPQIPLQDMPVVTAGDDIVTTINYARKAKLYTDENNTYYEPDDDSIRRAWLGGSKTVQTNDNFQVDGLPTQSKSILGAEGTNIKTGYENTTWNIHGFTGLLAKGQYAGIDIRDIRLASAVQRFLEKNARGGCRYIEWLYTHFGVRSSDARLQRPEYLGGGKSPVVIGEVTQQSESGNTPQGWMTGQGVSAQRSLGWTRSFEEFGYVIGILSLRPTATYEQGLHRMWSRFGRYDQILPAFAGVGDQAVPIKELYAASTNPEETFGYVPRYEECRRMPSSVHGEFRVKGGTLGYWHLGRAFDSEPVLGQDFIECNPSDRVFAVEDASYDKILVDIFHNISAIRPLPKSGTPGIDRL